MAKVCDYTTTAIVVLPDGTHLPLLAAGRSPQAVNVCRQWTELPSTDFAARVDGSDLAASAGTIFGLVMVMFAVGLLAGLIMASVRRAAGLNHSVE